MECVYFRERACLLMSLRLGPDAAQAKDTGVSDEPKDVEDAVVVEQDTPNRARTAKARSKKQRSPRKTARGGASTLLVVGIQENAEA